MRDNHIQKGRIDALTTFGLTKQASLIDRSVIQGLRGLKSVGSGLKTMAIGNPSVAMKELRAGTLMQPGGQLHEAFVPKGVLGKAMTYGLPALSLYQAAQAPSQDRGSALGSVIGANLGGMLGQPLGMLGSMGGSALLGGLGQDIGSIFDKKVPERPSGLS